jgi:hypothetical protein
MIGGLNGRMTSASGYAVVQSFGDYGLTKEKRQPTVSTVG